MLPSMPSSPTDLRGRGLYSDRDLDSIIEAAGGDGNVCRRELAVGLSLAVLAYASLVEGQDAIKRQDWTGKKYDKVQQCCEALLDALDDLEGSFDAGTENSPPKPDGMRQLLWQLHDWAQWQSGLRFEVRTHGGSRRSSDRAMDAWIAFLTRIYRFTLGKQPGFSVNGGRVSGSFVRYLDACIRPVLGSAPRPEALRSRWQQLPKESDPSGQCP